MAGRRANREGWSGYLGTAPGDATASEYAVPARRTDLVGLPPAFLTWGDIELFADEDDAYAQALQQAGVSVTTDVVEGAPHGFENWANDTPAARALVERAQDWLRGVIADADADDDGTATAPSTTENCRAATSGRRDAAKSSFSRSAEASLVFRVECDVRAHLPPARTGPLMRRAVTSQRRAGVFRVDACDRS